MKGIFSISHIFWWIGGFIGFHLLPHGVSSYYNAATTADDYCFADTIRTYGLGKAIYFYYTQVNGRYTGIVFQHALNSMAWESQILYQVMPFLCIVCLGWMFFKVVQEFTGWPLWASVLGSAGIWVVFLDTLPSLSEGVYWLSSLYIHGLSWITFLGILYCLGKLKERPSFLPWALATLFVAGGISEATYLNTFVVVAAWGIWQIVQERKLTKPILAVGTFAVIGLLLIKFSPANIGRQSEEVSNITPKMVQDSILYLAKFLTGQWSWSLSLLSLLFLGLGVQWKLEHAVFKIPLWYALGVVTILSVGPYLVSSLGIGGVPPRILNVTSFFFLLSWLYVILRASRSIPQVTFPEYTWPLILFILGLTTLQHNTKIMYRDWYRGVYSGYRAEVEDRISRLKSDATWVVIEPFQHRPHSIFFSEMDKNTNGLWAKCLSQYYHKPIQFIEN